MNNSQPPNIAQLSTAVSDSQKYQALLQHLQQGFCIIEVLFDEQEQPLDYRFLEVNLIFEQQTGLVDAVGKTMRQLQPAHEQHWFELYGQVAKTGQSVHVEQQAAHLAGGVWYEVFAFALATANNQVAILFDDITDRKLREQQQAFLLSFADAVRPLIEPEQIQVVACRLLGIELGASRVNYAEVHGADYNVANEFLMAGLPSMKGRYPIDSFRPEEINAFRAGKTVVIGDIAAEPRLSNEAAEAYEAIQVRAFISVPIVKVGQLVFVLSVIKSEPYLWSQYQIALAEEIAERTWAAVERAKAEAALAKSEERLQLATNAAQIGTFIYYPQEDRGEPDAQMLALYGLPPDNTLNLAKALAELLHPDDRQRYANEVAQALNPAGSGKLDSDIRIVHPDGSLHWMNVRGQVLFENGQVIRMPGVSTDITERKRWEQQQAKAAVALQASQQRFESIANLVPDLLWDSEPDGSTNWYNDRWLAYTGQTFEEAIGWGWIQVIHPDDRERSAKRYNEAVKAGQPLRQEYRIRRDDGAYRWFVVNALPLKDERGRVVKMYGAATDIHDRKEAEEALQESEKRLRLTDRRKDEFLAMLAHELRNPMSTIRSGLQILTITNGQDETSSTTLSMMNRQTDHLVRMVDDLLDVSRISQGKIALKTQPLNLVEVVAQAAESVQALYQEQGRVLQVNLPPTPIEIEGDGARLSQVVTNLLTNGVRYTGEQGQVWLTLEHRSQEAILQVRDNGIGLAADQLESIFELFIQVDNSLARSKGGLGLGLTLVKRLVEMHGGRVAVQSAGIGQGSTFTVHLPTSAPAAESRANPAPPIHDPSAAQRILVIDDNADAGFTLAMLLKLKGYEAHTRTSGLAVIEAAEDLKPSAILLDIGMPELDGYATCRLIRERPWGQDIVVIALTGYGLGEDRQRTKEAGFDGHLVKPVDLGELTKLLTDLLTKGSNL